MCFNCWHKEQLVLPVVADFTAVFGILPKWSVGMADKKDIAKRCYSNPITSGRLKNGSKKIMKTCPSRRREKSMAPTTTRCATKEG